MYLKNIKFFNVVLTLHWGNRAWKENLFARAYLPAEQAGIFYKLDLNDYLILTKIASISCKTGTRKSRLFIVTTSI